MSRTDFDVLIIGAGVAGATAAIRLAEAGWSVALIEKQTFPRRKVCGECVAAPNLPLLDALGVGAAFGQMAGEPLRRIGLCVGNEIMVAAMPGYADADHRWGRALGREHLDTLLLQRAIALGARVWQPWAVRDVRHDGSRHVCHIRSTTSGETTALVAAVLIDAHGAWTADPGADMAQRPAPRASDLFAFKGNFSESTLDPDLLPVLAFAGGYGGMVRGEGGLLTLACCIRRDALHTIRQRMPGLKASAAVQMHLADSCRGVRETLQHARAQGDWLSVGPIRPGLRACARSPTHFAIGNAAGEAHPILGEGISMAIQSAWLLCDALVARRRELTSRSPGLTTAQAYENAWQRNFAPRIRFAALLAQLAMRPHGWRWAMPLLRRWPGLLTASARIGGKVTCAVQPPPSSTNALSLAAVRAHSIQGDT